MRIMLQDFVLGCCSRCVVGVIDKKDNELTEVVRDEVYLVYYRKSPNLKRFLLKLFCRTNDICTIFNSKHSKFVKTLI